MDDLKSCPHCGDTPLRLFTIQIIEDRRDYEVRDGVLYFTRYESDYVKHKDMDVVASCSNCKTPLPTAEGRTFLTEKWRSK